MSRPKPGAAGEVHDQPINSALHLAVGAIKRTNSECDRDHLRIATRTNDISGSGIPSYNRKPFRLPLSTGKRRHEFIHREHSLTLLGFTTVQPNLRYSLRLEGMSQLIKFRQV